MREFADMRTPFGRVRWTVMVSVVAGLLSFTVAYAQTLPQTIKIGVLTDLSGSTADAAGPGSVVAAKLAAEDFGNRVAGTPVEIISADHQNKSDVASGIARQWIDREGVSAIVDLPYTQIAIAVVEIAKQKDRAVLIASAASSDLTGQFCSAVSTHWTDDTYALSAGTARVLTKAGKKTWFFVTADYAFGKAMQRDATTAVEGEGGKVLGSMRHPLPSPDMAPYLLQASASGAQAVGLANVGADTITAIKQAAEFGLTDKGQTMVGLQTFISDVHSLGLGAARGLIVTTGFYWDRNDATRAFAERFRKVTGKMPTKPQAAVYASVKHWLKAVESTKSISGAAITTAMRDIPVEYFGSRASIRPDGRVLYDLTVYQVKSAAESKGPWDYYKTVAELKQEEAFRPIAEGQCPLIK